MTNAQALSFSQAIQSKIKNPNIKVNAAQDRIILEGKAKSQEEKDSVSKLAEEIVGTPKYRPDGKFRRGPGPEPIINLISVEGD